MTLRCPTCQHYVRRLTAIGRVIRNRRRLSRNAYLDSGLRLENSYERHQEREGHAPSHRRTAA